MNVFCRSISRVEIQMVAKRSLPAAIISDSCNNNLTVGRISHVCGIGQKSHIRYFSVNRFPLVKIEPIGSRTFVKSRNNSSTNSTTATLSSDEQGRVIVYNGPLKGQIRALKFFSLSTSVMGLIAQPIIYQYTANSSVAASIALFGLVGFYTFVTPMLIHTLAKKYVIQLLYSPTSDKYTAVTFNFVCRRKELDFSVDEVTVPDVPGPFSTIMVKKVINGKEKKLSLFLPPESREFEDPRHYGRIMGFDKPLDLHLETEPTDKVESRKSQG